jgi:hypothetical protein
MKYVSNVVIHDWMHDTSYTKIVHILVKERVVNMYVGIILIVKMIV